MSLFRKVFFIVLVLCTTQTIAKESRVETVAQLPGVPWGMDFINDNELIVTIRSGSVFLLNLGNGQLRKLNGLPEIAVDGQG